MPSLNFCSALLSQSPSAAAVDTRNCVWAMAVLPSIRQDAAAAASMVKLRFVIIVTPPC